jgi:hypothetical protein
MIGSDFHDEVSPPGVPVPSIPHLVMGMLCFPPWGVVTGKPNGTVWTTTGMSMAQGTDIGFFIPHIPIPPAPANILAPILTIGSGSKSNFGAHNHKTPLGPLAFACLGVVNLNLNCGGPTMPPLPSGFVLAVFQLTWQGVTWGDLIAGALHMLVDIFIQYRINKFFATGLGSKALGWMMGRVAGALAARTTVMGVRMSTLGVKTLGDLILTVMEGRTGRFVLGYGLAEQLPGILAATGVGTPIGYSPDWAPTSRGEGLGDKAQDSVAQSLDDMFNSPAVEEHPSAPSIDAGGGSDGTGATAPPDGGAPPDASVGADAGSGGSSSSAAAGSAADGGAPVDGPVAPGSSSNATEQGGVCGPDDDGETSK